MIKQIDFVNHSYYYRPNWTPLSPVTITYYYYYYYHVQYYTITSEIMNDQNFFPYVV